MTQLRPSLYFDPVRSDRRGQVGFRATSIDLSEDSAKGVWYQKEVH